MAVDMKTIRPKPGKSHWFFGSRFLKMHNMRDPRWTITDKFEQYKGLQMLHEKDQRLVALACAAATKKRSQKISQLQQDLVDDRKALYMAKMGDSTRTQLVLQNDKKLQRLYQSMPAHLIIENMDQQTFMKRKEFDRLIDQRNKLKHNYESKLMELSLLQNRGKYIDVLPLENEKIANKLGVELKNSLIRKKAIKTINLSYQRIIATMMQDSRYFEPVLDALEEDIAEQQSFIATSIRLGRPALASFEKLSKAHKRLQKKIERDINPRLDILRQYRQQIADNNKAMYKLVRRDSDIQIDKTRYARQTPSMMQFKANLEDVEKVMKQVKGTTSCDSASDVYPRIKRQFKENIRMEGNIIPKERERNAANERDAHAQVQREAHSHNFNDDEIDRLDKMESLRKQILDEDRAQIELNEAIVNRNKLLSTMKLSFQHILDVLRHVGDKHVAQRKYPNPDLNLPFLKFTNFEYPGRPPSPIEENVPTMLELLKKRAGLLMNVFDEEKFVKERENCILKFHEDVVRDRNYFEEEIASKRNIDQKLVNQLPAEDPLVITRLSLKKSSNLIVEKNTKKDDW